eukprot:TRINITY_DN1349_c0_g1_i1.p1 TRINITY_DN1349_c0_g1~~TRINITY_DN1349_c0_g1_i1.p1  ORF type:complete len:218 (+),score=32.67 TRINITY_DN1349_c0_g1_i1:107-760(+)
MDAAREEVKHFKEFNPNRTIFAAFQVFLCNNHKQREIYVNAIKDVYSDTQPATSKTNKKGKEKIGINEPEEVLEDANQYVRPVQTATPSYDDVRDPFSPLEPQDVPWDNSFSYGFESGSSFNEPFPDLGKQPEAQYPPGTWKWQRDDGAFVPYDKNTSDLIETNYHVFRSNSKHNCVRFNIQGTDYFINFQNVVGLGYFFQQAVANHSRRRRVQRVD